MPRLKTPQRGFVLPAAAFLLVILGGLALYLTHVTQLNQAVSALELQGERAYWAAQAGAEAAMYQVTHGAGCTASQNIVLPEGFTVTAQCVATQTKEGGKPVTVHTLTGIACNEPVAGGACPNPAPGRRDYVERQIVVQLE